MVKLHRLFDFLQGTQAPWVAQQGGGAKTEQGNLVAFPLCTKGGVGAFVAAGGESNQGFSAYFMIFVEAGFVQRIAEFRGIRVGLGTQCEHRVIARRRIFVLAEFDQGLADAIEACGNT